MKLPYFKSVVAAASLATGLMAVATTAQAEGLYFGGALGVPHFDKNINGVSGSGNGISGKLFGGYQLTPNFAVEAGVADLGRINNSSGKVYGRGTYIDAVGLLPLNNQLSMLGSIGVARVGLDTSNGDSSGTGLKVGLGGQYALSKNVALRAEWERYHARAFGDRPDIDQFTLGVRVGF